MLPCCMILNSLSDRRRPGRLTVVPRALLIEPAPRTPNTAGISVALPTEYICSSVLLGSKPFHSRSRI